MILRLEVFTVIGGGGGGGAAASVSVSPTTLPLRQPGLLLLLLLIFWLPLILVSFGVAATVSAFPQVNQNPLLTKSTTTNHHPSFSDFCNSGRRFPTTSTSTLRTRALGFLPVSDKNNERVVVEGNRIRNANPSTATTRTTIGNNCRHLLRPLTSTNQSRNYRSHSHRHRRCICSPLFGGDSSTNTNIGSDNNNNNNNNNNNGEDLNSNSSNVDNNDTEKSPSEGATTTSKNGNINININGKKRSFSMKRIGGRRRRSQRLAEETSQVLSTTQPQPLPPSTTNNNKTNTFSAQGLITALLVLTLLKNLFLGGSGGDSGNNYYYSFSSSSSVYETRINPDGSRTTTETSRKESSYSKSNIPGRIDDDRQQKILGEGTYGTITNNRNFEDAELYYDDRF